MSRHDRPFALLANDLHVDKNNIEEFEKNWAEMLSVCKERGVDYIIVGGDLWTNRAAQTLPVLKAVQKAILDARRNYLTIIIAEGNHDLIDQEDTFGYSHIFDPYPGVHVVDEWHIIPLGKHNLVIMSYFPENGSFTEKLEAIKNKLAPELVILYIHEGISGALSQSSDNELPAKLFKGFHKVLVGHYHNRTQIGDNIFYIGASRQHNFGEDEEKGYTLLYPDGATEFVKNQVNTRYITITVTNENIMVATRRISELTKAGYKVRVKVECNAQKTPVISKQALLDMGVNKIEVVTEELPIASASQALEAKYDKAGIKKEYVDFCRKKDIDDVATGISYLEKIS